MFESSVVNELSGFEPLKFDCIFDLSCKYSSLEAICIKHQSLFSGIDKEQNH